MLNKSVNARGGTVVPAFPRLLGWCKCSRSCLYTHPANTAPCSHAETQSPGHDVCPHMRTPAAVLSSLTVMRALDTAS